MISSAFQRALRPQETTPGAEFRNPTDLVDKLVFFARALPFIPHHAILGFPVRVDARRKRRSEERFCISSGCGHKYHPLALQFPKVPCCGQRSRYFDACQLPFQKVSVGRVSEKRTPRNPLC